MLYSWLHLLWAALISPTVVLPTLLFFVVLFLLLIPCCNVIARSQVNALIDKADALGSSGNYIQAIQYYDKALAIDPNNVAALINKGNSLNSLGNYADAIQYYDRALTLNPNSFNKVTALSDKGAALNGLGKYSQAITYIDEALAIDPNNVNALINKGNSFSDLGNYAQAIQYYNDALNVDPNNALASTNKGHVVDLLEKQQQNSNQQPASSIGATATQPTTVGCGPGTDNSTCSSSTASEQSSSSQVPSTTTSDNSPIIIPYSSNYYYKVVPAQAEQDFQNTAFNNLPPPGFSEGTAAFGTAYDGCPMYGQKKATDWQINTDILLLKKFVLPASNPMVADVSVVVDNDVQVFINGVDISGGLVTHENCASYEDPFVFHVPEGVLKAGGNILAVRGHDRGIADFLDVQLVGAQRPYVTLTITTLFEQHISLNQPAPIPCVIPWPFLVWIAQQ